MPDGLDLLRYSLIQQTMHDSPTWDLVRVNIQIILQPRRGPLLFLFPPRRAFVMASMHDTIAGQTYIRLVGWTAVMAQASDFSSVSCKYQ